MKKIIAAALACLLALACFATGAAAIETQEEMPPLLITYVTYEDFGAAGDGATDDLDAIVAAHEAANERNLSVRVNPDATYYIAQAGKTAVIQTDTDWGTARFIIDDSKVQVGQGHNLPIFEVKSTQASRTVTGIGALKKGQANIGVALGCGALLHIADANTLRYIRKGVNANDGQAQQEVIRIDKDGNVDPDTPVIWDYAAVTSATAYPVDAETLTISGGQFTTIANQAESFYNYHHRGIRVARSNTVVDGLKHLITGELDHGAPYTGFVDVTRCTDVTVQNCTFSGHKFYPTQREGGTSQMGTYDININNATNVTFKDCAQVNSIHDSSLWGLMGSNYVKNIALDGVAFSRFDAHMGVHNATIKNSQLGHMGINLIGSGTALIENTTVSGRRFINLRSDYGSVWDGEVVIKNCVFDQSNGNGSDYVLLGGDNDGTHDFGYPCRMPRKITIDGLVIRDKQHSPLYFGPKIFDSFGGIWLYITDLFKAPSYPYGVTEQVVLRNITTESGMRLGKSLNFPRFWKVQVTRQ